MQEGRRIDWTGILAWSTKHHDGTNPSNFKPMSKEDRDWLEAAMKENAVNDTDRMEEIIKDLKTRRESESKELDHDKINDMLEELLDLVELHERNNLNMCIYGGMIELLSLGLSYPNDEVRRSALQLITSANTNNLQV